MSSMSAFLAVVLLMPAPVSDLLPPRLAATLQLVPANAVALLAIPNPKLASDDLGQCLDRMDRPETAVAGRPIDQAKAALGISASFDDSGPLVIFQLPAGPDAFTPIALLPSTDPAAFAQANFTAAPDAGADAWRLRDGQILFVKPLLKHVAIGPSAETVRTFTPPADGGIAAILRERLGDRGVALAAGGDAFVWGGRSALTAALREGAAQANEALEADVPFADAARDAQRTATELLAGVEDGLVVVDIDPLGLSLRTWARFDGESELAALAAGGPSRATRFDRVPKAPFYFALRADLSGLGGLPAIERLLARLPGGFAVPTWLAEQGEHLHGLQFAVAPSRMGIASGGLLNDATLFLASEQPNEVRNGIRRGIESTATDGAGVTRTVTWTSDKSLRSGETADAFEVEETLRGDLPAERTAELGIRRLVTQIIFGSRGFVGFVKPTSGGAIMTFSQRTDVLDRALQTSAGGASLADDPTLASYGDWLIEGADVEGFIGVGEFGKLIQQLATMVPGGEGIPLPQIPTSVEPVAFALNLKDGTAESALVVPTGVLALFYDEVKRQAQARILGRPENAAP